MKLITRLIAFFLILTFGGMSICPPDVAAQLQPSAVSLQPSVGATPRGRPNEGRHGSLPLQNISPVFSGIKIYPQEPFRFDFIVSGADATLDDPAKPSGEAGFPQERIPPRPYKEGEFLKLVKYFMASLTVPEGDLWVNLSPYEQDRIVPEALGQTEMGIDLLAQDYVLKQLTASLMNPEGETGKKFWDKIYSQAYEQLGTTDVPVDTFNKVWIVPDRVEVYQNNDVAYIVDARLKVMLESDYLAEQKSQLSSQRTLGPSDFSNDAGSRVEVRDDSSVKNIIRDIILPVIEEEVNNGPSFANLRQIFHSMILAKWYEQHFRNSVLGQSYVDRNVIEGIVYEKVTGNEERERGTKDFRYALHGTRYHTVEDIYNQYVQAYKQGAYDFLKEEYDPATQTIVPRRYFAGGFDGKNMAMLTTRDMLAGVLLGSYVMIQVACQSSRAPDVQQPGDVKPQTEAVPISPEFDIEKPVFREPSAGGAPQAELQGIRIDMDELLLSLRANGVFERMTKEDLLESIRFSNQSSYVSAVRQASEILQQKGVLKNNFYPVLFLRGMELERLGLQPESFALALGDLGIVVVPQEIFDETSQKTQEEKIDRLIEKISHEGKHIDNETDEPGMAPLQDEMLAYDATVEAVIIVAERNRPADVPPDFEFRSEDLDAQRLVANAFRALVNDPQAATSVMGVEGDAFNELNYNNIRLDGQTVIVTLYDMRDPENTQKDIAVNFNADGEVEIKEADKAMLSDRQHYEIAQNSINREFTEHAQEMLTQIKSLMMSAGVILDSHILKAMSKTEIVISDHYPGFGELLSNGEFQDRPVILINSALYRAMNDAQRAFVIGHEFGHVILSDVNFTIEAQKLDLARRAHLRNELEDRCDAFGIYAAVKTFPATDGEEIADSFHQMDKAWPDIRELRDFFNRLYEEKPRDPLYDPHTKESVRKRMIVKLTQKFQEALKPRGKGQWVITDVLFAPFSQDIYARKSFLQELEIDLSRMYPRKTYSWASVVYVLNDFLNLLKMSRFLPPRHVEPVVLYLKSPKTGNVTEEQFQDFLLRKTMEKRLIRDDRAMLDSGEINLKDVLEAYLQTISDRKRINILVNDPNAIIHTMRLFPLQMSIIFSEVIENALDEQKEGLIDVSLEKKGADVVFTVRNQGMIDYSTLRQRAADAADQRKLMERDGKFFVAVNGDLLPSDFRVVSRSEVIQMPKEQLPFIKGLSSGKRTSDYGKQGKGVPYVQGLVEVLGGTFALESKNGFTTAVITLPVDQAMMATPAERFDQWYPQGQQEGVYRPFGEDLEFLPFDTNVLPEQDLSIRRFLDDVRQLEERHGWPAGTIVLFGGGVRNALMGKTRFTSTSDVDFLIRGDNPDVSEDDVLRVLNKEFRTFTVNVSVVGQAYDEKGIQEILARLERESFLKFELQKMEETSFGFGLDLVLNVQGAESNEEIEKTLGTTFTIINFDPDHEFIGKWHGLVMDHVGFYTLIGKKIFLRDGMDRHFFMPTSYMWMDTGGQVFDPSGAVGDLLVDKIFRFGRHSARDYRLRQASKNLRFAKGINAKTLSALPGLLARSVKFDVQTGYLNHRSRSAMFSKDKNFIRDHMIFARVLRAVRFKFELGLEFSKDTQFIIENFFSHEFGDSDFWRAFYFGKEYVRLKKSGVSVNELVELMRNYVASHDVPLDVKLLEMKRIDRSLKTKNNQEMLEYLDQIVDETIVKVKFHLLKMLSKFESDRDALEVLDYLRSIGLERITDPLDIDPHLVYLESRTVLAERGSVKNEMPLYEPLGDLDDFNQAMMAAVASDDLQTHPEDLEKIARFLFEDGKPLVIDLGTGQAKLPYAIAQNHPEWNVVGVDQYPLNINESETGNMAYVQNSLLWRDKKLPGQLNNTDGDRPLENFALAKDRVSEFLNSVPENSVEAFTIVFPDQATQDFYLSSDIMSLLKSKLRPGGKIYIMPLYMYKTEEVLGRHGFVVMEKRDVFGLDPMDYTSFAAAPFMQAYVYDAAMIAGEISADDQILLEKLRQAKRDIAPGQKWDEDQTLQFFRAYKSLDEERLKGLLKTFFREYYGDGGTLRRLSPTERRAVRQGIELYLQKADFSKPLTITSYGPGDSLGLNYQNSDIYNVLDELGARADMTGTFPDVVIRAFDYSQSRLSRLENNLQYLSDRLYESYPEARGKIKIEVNFADFYEKDLWNLIHQESNITLLRRTWIAFNRVGRGQVLSRDEFMDFVGRIRERIRTGALIVRESISRRAQPKLTPEAGEYFTVAEAIDRQNPDAPIVVFQEPGIAELDQAMMGGTSLRYGQKNRVVLVVDDTPADRFLAKMRFEELGYRVIEAGSPQEAFQQLDEHPDIDFVLTDKDVPVTNSGLEFVAQIDTEKFPNLFAVMWTAAGMWKDIPPSGRLVKVYEKVSDLDQIWANVDDAVRLMAEKGVTPALEGDQAMMLDDKNIEENLFSQLLKNNKDRLLQMSLEEMVRKSTDELERIEAGTITWGGEESINKEHYIQNQRYLRKGFYRLLQDVANQRIVNMENLKDRIRVLHINLITGQDGKTYYIPLSRRSEDLTAEEWAQRYAGVFGGMRIDYYGENDMQEFQLALDEYFERLLILLKEFTEINDRSAAIDKILDIYVHALIGPARHLLFEKGNNSFWMNLVNLMLKVHDLEPVMHGRLDYEVYAVKNGEKTLAEFKEGFLRQLQSAFDKGGIDLNNLNMQTSGQAEPIIAPGDPAMLKQTIHGLTPKILNIAPVNAYQFLGLNDPQEAPFTDHAQDSQPADRPLMPKLSMNRED